MILDRIVAMEMKVVRASFVRQGKSPNEMGHSQAQALLDLGFPYVAVVHLIVSDQSPEHAWEPMMRTLVLDEEGRCAPLENVLVDKMPYNLMARAIDRLRSTRKNPAIGLVAAFFGASDADFLGRPRGDNMWYPDVLKGQRNANMKLSTLHSVANFFERDCRQFMDTPRFDPPR